MIRASQFREKFYPIATQTGIRSVPVGIYALLLIGSCLIVLFLTPLLRRMAAENGYLDHPGERKVHKNAVPRIGGVAIAVAFYVSLALIYALFHDKLRGSMMYLTGFSIGAMIIILVGIWDDLWGLNAPKKIAGQIAAALMLMPFGFVIRELNIPFVGIVQVGWELGALFAIFWIVGIVNTINFIDGIDGLAAGVAVIISLALFAVSIATGQVLMAAICVVLVGGALGFLRHNFHPATIFMGDCGAMLLGFVLAAVSIKVLFQNPSVSTGPLTSVLIFGLPVVDTTWAIIRRLAKRESPFCADKQHIHHRFVDIGLTQRQTVVALYAISSLSAAAGVIVALFGNDKSGVIISACMMATAAIGVAMLSRMTASRGSQIDCVCVSVPEQNASL